jgi:hypothetical protein
MPPTFGGRFVLQLVSRDRIKTGEASLPHYGRPEENPGLTE